MMRKADHLLSALDILNISVMLSSLALVHRMTTCFGFTFSVASMIFPLSYVLTNFVARTYGFSQANQIMWRGLLAQIPFSLIVTLLEMLPDAHDFPAGIVYEKVFANDLRITFACIFAAWCGYKVNFWVLSHRVKTLSHKLFGLINIGACGLAELVFTLVALPLMFIGSLNTALMLSSMGMSLFIKFLYSTIFCLPTSYLAQKLE